MFWKDAPLLRSLSLPSKLAVSFFLVLAGIGYVFGFFNVLVTYQMTDGEPGLSVKDVELTYYGSPVTALESSINGSMRSAFSSDDNYDVVKDWISLGGDENTYGFVQRVFTADCISCHNSETYAAAGLALESYDSVAPYLQKDTGKSISRLISLSHNHLLSTIVVVFLLVFVFSFSSFPDWLKMVLYILAFSAIVLDIGSWWLAKLAPSHAVLVIVGGVLLGTSFGALTLLALWDTWFGKEE